MPSSAFKDWRSILRRWPKAGRVTFDRIAALQGSGADSTTSSITEDVTLGGGGMTSDNAAELLAYDNKLLRLRREIEDCRANIAKLSR